MKKIFKNLHSLIWFIVSTVLAFILLVGSIVCMGLIPKVMDNLFGGEGNSGRTDTASERFTPDKGITDKASALKNANDINEKICEEGFVLLKNEGVLPVATPASTVNKASAKPKISVFGKNSVNLVYGGSGSGAGNTKGAKTIYDSLSEAGYDCNPSLKSFYESNDKSGNGRPGSLSIEANKPVGFATGETPVASYDDLLKSSFNSYKDLALVVISRTCGEGNDVPLTMKNTVGAYSESDHYLETDKNEQEMLKMVCDNFENVVLVINSSQTLELGFLDSIGAIGDDTMLDYDFASHIKGAVWVGGPGSSGIMALGRILNGSVNPSGRTVDTYARDFTKSPAYVNFSASDAYFVNGSEKAAWYSDYEEGIYVGYRYYETAAKEGFIDYDKSVIYPFGYGLSYTKFNREIANKSELDGKELTADSKLTVKVKVDNVGDYAGKDVVQLYVSTPYTRGGIEKAHKTLVAFAKTDILDAKTGTGEVELKFNAYDLASYDGSDANGNGFKGYELEAGNYEFFVSENSHKEVEKFTMTVAKSASDDVTGIKYEKDPNTNKKVENLYDDMSEQLSKDGKYSTLTRADFEGSWPKVRSQEEADVNSAFMNKINSTATNNPLSENSDEVKNANLEFARKKDKEGLQLPSLYGVKYNDSKWDEMVARLAVSSWYDLLSLSAFGSDTIDYITKPKTLELDGPVGFTQFMGGGGEVSDTCAYASECVVGSTLNIELAKAEGVAVGNEGLIGYRSGDKYTPYSGWYAPGVNIHRTPFGGRNYEYYSEDATLNGFMAAGVIDGAWSKGLVTYMKHFVANDSETHRNGVCTWLTEQSLREIYLKPFEIAVKNSESHGVMSSFNRLGTIWTGGDYRLLTTILREEWGFEGAVITDFVSGAYMNYKQCVYAGGDVFLNNQVTYSPEWVDKSNKMDIYVMKKAVKNYLYVTANSSAMVGLVSESGDVVNLKTIMATWRILLITADCVIPVALAVWGFFAVNGALKKKEDIEQPSQEK